MNDSIQDFPDLFDFYLDLNELELESSDLIRDALVAQEHSRVLTYHRYGFLFYYFDKLLREDISRDQFLMMGDIGGLLEDQINPQVYRENNPVQIDMLTPQVIESWTTKDLVFVDKLLTDVYMERYSAFPKQNNIIILSS